MPPEFAPLADSIVDALLAANPSAATFAGDHRFDDRLDDFSADGVAERVTMLRQASDTLAAADVDELVIGEQIDHAILQARVDQELFELTEVREHEWNPLSHNPGALLDALIERPTAPAEVRLASLAARLASIPDALATARAMLRNVPQIHLETGAGQFTGTAALVRDGVPRLLAEAPALGGDVKPVAEEAMAALDEFSGWLRAQAAQDVDRPSPRLGRRLWEARLWHTLDTELSATQVMEAAQRRVADLSERMRECAVAMIGGPHDDDTVRRALAECAERRPDDTTIVGRATEALADTTEFVRQFELVSLVDDPCVVKEMPEYARGVAVAYCDPPGPLETANVPTLYCISPTPADWSAERVESFYREYNDDLVPRSHDPRGDAGSLPATGALAALPRHVEGTGARILRSVRRGLGVLRGRGHDRRRVRRPSAQAPAAQGRDALGAERDPRPVGALRRHVRGRGDGTHAAPRLPGRGRGGRQMASCAADVDPAVDVFRRLLRGQRDRSGAAGRIRSARLA